MADLLVFDCEFLTAPGSPSRFWCGPQDPDPVVAQIGVVRLGLEGDFPIRETLRLFVVPKDRAGQRVALDPFFTRLTGITEGDLDREGLALEDALARVARFAEDARLWSWGKDEFNMIAISCYVEGIAPPLCARQFGNACDLVMRAGMPLEEIGKARSNTLAACFGIEHPPLAAHDALGDALGVAYVLQHLLRTGALPPEACH